MDLKFSVFFGKKGSKKFVAEFIGESDLSQLPRKA